jgi:hypothetical protein
MAHQTIPATARSFPVAALMSGVRRNVVTVPCDRTRRCGPGCEVRDGMQLLSQAESSCPTIEFHRSQCFRTNKEPGMPNRFRLRNGSGIPAMIFSVSASSRASNTEAIAEMALAP